MKRARRRALKWAITTACIVVLLAWAASFSWFYGYVIRIAGDQYAIQTIPNQFGLGFDRGLILQPGFHAIEVPRVEIEGYRVLVGGPMGKGPANFVYIAFWMPALPLAIAAVWLWIVDRRPGRNCCPKCGYPVGTSDKCTECGSTLSLRAIEQ